MERERREVGRLKGGGQIDSGEKSLSSKTTLALDGLDESKDTAGGRGEDFMGKRW